MPRKNRKPRNTGTLFRIGGVLVEAHTVTGLARIVGKSRDTILRYEDNGVFPTAPILRGNIRYYPTDLCRKLIPLVRRIPCNRKIDAELIVEINRVFKEERDRLITCRKQ